MSKFDKIEFVIYCLVDALASIMGVAFLLRVLWENVI